MSGFPHSDDSMIAHSTAEHGQLIGSASTAKPVQELAQPQYGIGRGVEICAILFRAALVRFHVSRRLALFLCHPGTLPPRAALATETARRSTRVILAPDLPPPKGHGAPGAPK